MLKKPLEVLQLYSPHDYTLEGLYTSRLKAGEARPFVIHNGKTWAWGEFASCIDKAAGLLAGHGIRKGDRVAVMARNSEKHVLLLLAAARIGAILVPINPELGRDETGYLISHSGPSALFFDDETSTVAQEARAQQNGRPWLVTFGRASHIVPAIDSLLERAQPFRPAEKVAAEDTCLIVYTSGTTGFPKGVMHSQRTFVTVGESFVQRISLQPDDRILVVLPMFHINALFYSVAGTLAAGAAMIVASRFSASNFWSIAADNGATEVNIIEAIGSILVKRPRSEFRPDHVIQKVYGVRQGAAPTFRDEFHIPHLITGYGMTEIPGVLSSPFDGRQKPGSMGVLGRHPDPERSWSECRVVDEEGHDVAAGAEGELIVKTPTIMQGYFRDPEQTAAAFRDGWFLTSDLVRRDADGYFYFVSRKKDIIRRRGENISGAELDRVIGEHPGVHEVATIAVPSDLGEDEILAAIVRESDQEVTTQEIVRWCGERLAAQKVPRYILFVDDLPHTPTHKVAKNVLRSDASLKSRAVDVTAQQSQIAESKKI